MHHFVAIGEFKLELQSGNAQSRSNSTIFRAVWPWNLTDDLASKQHEAICIISSSYVNSNWSYGPETAKLGVTLTFDFWPWPFAWTSLLSLVITPENSWWYDDGNIVKKVWQTDGRTENTIHRAAWSQLKMTSGMTIISNWVNMRVFNKLRCWFSKASKVLPKWICSPNMKSINGILFYLSRKRCPLNERSQKTY